MIHLVEVRAYNSDGEKENHIYEIREGETIIDLDLDHKIMSQHLINSKLDLDWFKRFVTGIMQGEIIHIISEGK